MEKSRKETAPPNYIPFNMKSCFIFEGCFLIRVARKKVVGKLQKKAYQDI